MEHLEADIKVICCLENSSAESTDHGIEFLGLQWQCRH